MPDELNLLDPVRREYDELVAKGKIKSEPAQIELVNRFDQLISDIEAKRLSSKSSALGWLFNKKNDAISNQNGLYIWGGVGRGKSFLMDLFFDAADIAPKRRVHFNDFMLEAHQHIHNQRQLHKAGKTHQKDPIPATAKLLAEKSKLLCFDEFSVSDITDAMILGRLFKGLFENRVTIVATSNIELCDLYEDGLNRQLFLPFIDLMASKLEVIKIADGSDYRLEKLPGDKYYTWPLNERAERTMDEAWKLVTNDSKPQSETLKIGSRTLAVPRTAKGVARFEFDELCRQPRGASDYLAIANRYSAIMIDHIPVLIASERNEAKRLILLIDILYDHRCRIIVSADGPPSDLYQGNSGREAFEFDRTRSRLIEMQSLEYNNTGEGNITDIATV